MSQGAPYDEQSVFVAAALWIQNTLLGTLATSLAILAVAVVGLLMLSGRVDIRRGAGVVIGCFILFGAPTIVRGLRGGLDAMFDSGYTGPTPVVAPQSIATPRSAPPPFDPYGGAAVPRR